MRGVDMMKWMSFISGKFNKGAGAISGIFILIMGLIVTYEVIMRYVFASPTTWVLEISIYLNIASVFLAGGLTLRDKMHIRVDSLTCRFSNRNQILLQLISLILGLVYCFVLTWKGLELALNSLRLDEVSPTVLHIPAVIPYSCIAVGGALLILEFIVQIMEEISALRKAGWKRERTGNWVERYWPPVVFLILIALCGSLFLSKGLAPLGMTALLFVLIFGGMPIGFGLGLIGLFGFYLTFGGGPMLAQVPIGTYKILDDFIVVALPLFIILSTILNIGEIGSRLFEAASTWVRHLPGGLGVATIAACAVFAAITGSSSATVATIGLIAIPEMRKRNYERSFIYGTVAIGGVLGPLIPPSVFMILIGMITGDSVGKLFMAGMLPGILLAVIFAAYIVVHSLRSKTLVRIEPAPWKERWGSVRNAFFGFLAPIVVLGGIYSGIFTPTEAAGVGVVYSLLICALIYRTLSFKKLWHIILDGAKLNASIAFIVTGALVFGQVITMLQIPQRLCAYVAALPVSPMVILFLILAFILILGALMDEVSILLITYPILYYIFVTHFRFDSIWFALVFVVTLEVGLVAPPVGINLFVVQGIDRSAKFEEVVRGVLPFVLLMIASIFIFIYIKPLSTWLPGLIG
jgi:C4-dicarboxylate transporter DctM subunit